LTFTPICGRLSRVYVSVFYRKDSQLIKNPVELLCQTCGSTFIVPSWRTKNGRAKFCSRDCRKVAPTIQVRTPEERFWEKVNKTDSCWLWIGAKCGKDKHGNGYGTFSIDSDGTMQMTHRYSYELHFGPIPEGIKVLHSCDVKLCVRPDHLFLGTQKQNIDDMRAKKRQAPPELTRHLGESHGQAKLTDKQIREIRFRYASLQRPTQKELAVEYGVSSGLISHIITRRNWTHVE
jgi:hypothetical protein